MPVRGNHNEYGLTKIKKALIAATAVALLAILGGCGGGGGGASARPVNPTSDAWRRNCTQGPPVNAPPARGTGTVNIAIAISGYYGVDDTEFTPLTRRRRSTPPAETPKYRYSSPIGVNHC